MDEPDNLAGLLSQRAAVTTQQAQSKHSQPASQTQMPVKQTQDGLPAIHRAAPEGIEADWHKVRPALRKLLRESCHKGAYPIYLFGEAGRGKTAAMACVYRSWPDDRVRWLRVSEFVALIQRCRRDGSIVLPGSNREVGEQHLWNTKVIQPALLCVDDIGLRSPTDSQFEIIFDLIDKRGTKPVIYTSNLSMKQVHETYDNRIASRLLRGQPIEITGDDRRLSNVEPKRV